MMPRARPIRRPGDLAAPYTVAEQIAARDLNNLYLTSRFFADPEKYRAFCAFYAVMRVVDDRVDDLPSRHGLSLQGRQREHDVLRAWEEAVCTSYEGQSQSPDTLVACQHGQAAPLLDAFAMSLGMFPVSRELWNNFFSAMHRDIDRARFDTWRDFLAYSEGASVAPTTIYLFLIASRRAAGDVFRVPEGFDIIACGRHLGVFAYLAHVARDLAADLVTGEEGLLYLTREDMEKFGVTERSLLSDVAEGQASLPTRALIAALLQRARRRLARGREYLEDLAAELEIDCRFILELIVTMYERIVDKIESCDFDPMSGRHTLSAEEKELTAREVAALVGFTGQTARADGEGDR